MYEASINEYPPPDECERPSVATDGYAGHREPTATGVVCGRSEATERTSSPEVPDCEVCPRNEFTECVTRERWFRAVEHEIQFALMFTELAEITVALDSALQVLPDMNGKELGGVPLDLILWGCSNHLNRLVQKSEELKV